MALLDSNSCDENGPLSISDEKAENSDCMYIVCLKSKILWSKSEITTGRVA